ncbi:MAG: hypothetical protein V4700_06525 [Pseudomonadota bacterium]
MGSNAFEIFIQQCGSVKEAAKILGLKREHVSAMRQGRIEVSLLNALMIEKYMKQHAGEIHHSDLVSPLVKNQLKRLRFHLDHPPAELSRVPINNVKHGLIETDFIENDPPDLNKLRPIILDEDQQLIANPITYLLYQQQHKRTVPAWRISLPDLLARKYDLTVLVQTFLICERAAIGIAAKKFLGNRQGPRVCKQFRRNFDEIKGRTDELIASLLKFGCKDSYRQTEKIQLFGSPELIQSVNEGTLRTSTAAQLTHFTHRKQQKILMRNKKEILTFIYRSKKR